MGIKRRYGQSISGEFCTNNIDNFQAVFKKIKKKKKKKKKSMYFMLSSPLCAK